LPKVALRLHSSLREPVALLLFDVLQKDAKSTGEPEDGLADLMLESVGLVAEAPDRGPEFVAERGVVCDDA
jgi:hypothetical protein